MVIHSVTPIPYLLPEPSHTGRRTTAFAGGWLEGEDTPEGFAISRVISTDPAAYLDPKLTPGCLYGGGSGPAGH